MCCLARGLIDPEWPSISSLCSWGPGPCWAQAGGLQPGAPLQPSRTAGARPRGDVPVLCASLAHGNTQPGAGTQAGLGSPETSPSPDQSPECPAHPVTLPTTSSPCPGDMAPVHRDGPRKGCGTPERVGRGAATQQPHSAECAADGMEGGAQPRELNPPAELGRN